MIKKEPNEAVLADAKDFLQKNKVGILATLDNYKGELYPSGSMCTYVLKDAKNIVILISDLALHTKNIKADNHVSMAIYEQNAKDYQNSARISLLAKARKVESISEEFQKVNELYSSSFPEAKTFLNIPGFSYYILESTRVHFIQGFGKIYTFEAELLKA